MDKPRPTKVSLGRLLPEPSSLELEAWIGAGGRTFPTAVEGWVIALALLGGLASAPAIVASEKLEEIIKTARGPAMVPSISGST
jgi:hypothetical protein